MTTHTRQWPWKHGHQPQARRLKIKQVDAFTYTPLTGNPAGVVLDAVGLETEQMQAIAREMNLSETTFILPPTSRDADYRVRFFGLRSELPFAGHPTIATVHAVIEEGRVYKGRTPNVVRQESAIGVVPVAVEKRPEGLFYLMTQAAPAWQESPIDRDQAAELLGCRSDDVMDLPVEIVSTGVPWIIIALTNLAAIQTLQPNMDRIAQVSRQLAAFGITTFSLETAQPSRQAHLRSFAPAEGVLEDPVDGTGNGSVGAYVMKHRLMDGSMPAGNKLEYVAEQGSEVLRPGAVTVRVTAPTDEPWTIQVGGHAATVLEGELLL